MPPIIRRFRRRAVLNPSVFEADKRYFQKKDTLPIGEGVFKNGASGFNVGEQHFQE
jgi:hypothetical protein